MKWNDKGEVIYEIDDWVVVTQRYRSNAATVGTTGQLSRITKGSDVPYCIKSLDSWCEDVRPATQEEIQNAIKFKELEMTIGSHRIKFGEPGGNAIEVGCQVVLKEEYLKIGQIMKWI